MAGSTTLSSSTVDYNILVHGKFNSTTVSKSSVDGYIRTYVNDPLAYQQSEPIFIYDRDENMQMTLSDNTMPYRDGWFTEQLNGSEVLDFEVLANNPEVEMIEEDGRAVIRNADGDFVEFIIRVVEDIDDSNGTFKIVQAEGGEYELIDEWITQYKASNVTLRTALNAILQGTRWQIGDVDDFGAQSVDLRNVSVKQGIYELLNIFGGERKSRVTVSGNRVTNRYLDVLKNRGVDTGKRFESGKDILSTSRVVDSSGIKTALYGFGASRENDLPRINFADVEWIKANGDPIDKPLGQAWVGDPEALQMYGYEQGRRHRFGNYDGQEEDPATLLLNTWRHLQTLNHVNETYDFNVITLEEITGYAHEKVRLGDRTFAINKRIHPEVIVENSNIEYRQNLNDHKLSEVTLGNFRRTYDLSNRFERVERDVNEKQGNWDNKPNTEYVDDVKSYAQQMIDEAQTRIDDANDRLDAADQELIDAGVRINDALDDILGLEYDLSVGNFHITEESILTGTIGAGDATFLNLTTRYMTAIEATMKDSTITGTLTANSATFQKGTFREATIIDATIENATITGELIGVTGSFIGNIETEKDARVGNVLHIGSGIPDRAELTMQRLVNFSSGQQSLGAPFYIRQAWLDPYGLEFTYGSTPADLYIGSLNLRGSINTENWKNFTYFANNWLSYSLEERPQYKKDAMGFVHFQGAIGRSSSSGAQGKFGTLPVGYRPNKLLRFAVSAKDSTTTAQVIIRPNGDMEIWGPTGIDEIVSLSSVSFQT